MKEDFNIRLSPKAIGNELSLDEYNAYQYLLYNFDCWKETIYLNMETKYEGDYATYLLQEESFLMGDKNGTYKIINELTSSSTITIKISDITELLDKDHLEFECTLYYKVPKVIDGNTYQPSDSPDMHYTKNTEHKETPIVERDFENKVLPCILDDDKIVISLWDSTNNEALFPVTSIISEKIVLKINLNENPWIDIKNGKANDPYEILIDTEEELANAIKYAPTDGSSIIIRLDSNRKPYTLPETLEISKGQNIEIRGGTSQYIANQTVQKGYAILDGTICRRTFIVKYGGNLKLDHLTLQNNNVTPYGTYDRGRGGAILVEAIRRENGVMKYGVLNCTNCTFSNNKAYNGGAIFSYHAGLFLDTCDFLDNYASSNGGAVYYWARDIRLKFDNMTIMDGETIYLKVKVTDYSNALVDEGVVDFYRKDGTGETLVGSIDVSNYVRLHEITDLATVPTTGTVKRIRTEHDSERRFDIVMKNNLPVTVTKNGTTLLKSPYDEDYNDIALEEGEKKVIAIFKNSRGTSIIPTVKDSSTGNTYVDYTKSEILKYLVYLEELVGYSYVPSNSSLKLTKTDTNEEENSIIVKDDLPVTVKVGEELFLKSPYDNDYNLIELDTGETLQKVVFKKKYENVTLPKVTNSVDSKKYLDFSDSSLLKYIVYNQEIDTTKTGKGWATLTTEYPKGNTKKEITYIAHYKGGAKYEDEVATATVNVIFPEKYTAKFVGDMKGAVGDTVTVNVQITDSKKGIITNPKGTFTINDTKVTAQVEGNYYFIKYEIPKNTKASEIDVSFTVAKSIYYNMEDISGAIKIVSETESISLKPSIDTPITGLFINPISVIETETKNTYTDEGITDDLVQQWKSNHFTDLFVRCLDYSDAKAKATLDTVVDKATNKGFRIHAVVECFCDTTVDSKDTDYMVKKWGNVNPSTIARRTAVNNNITAILENPGVDGICLDYVRFQGDAKNNSWNGNIAKNNRKTHVNEALSSFKTNITTIKPSCLISVTYMPEANAETDYGQKLLDMKGYVDYVIPLCYKGDYATESNDSDNWIVGKLKEYAKIINEDNILCCIQTYKSDAELEEATQKGKPETAYRTKTNLDTTIKNIAQVKVKGNLLFREGAITTYPISYKSARDTII